MWTVLHEDPEGPSRVLLAQVGHRQRAMTVRMRHLHRWRVTGQCHRWRGRPRQAVSRSPVPSQGGVVQVVPQLAFVGVHLVAHGLAQQGAFAPVVAPLPQAIETHQGAPPDDDFALVHHREPPLRQRLPALCFAPLFGMEPLTACDTREHPLPPLLGHG